MSLEPLNESVDHLRGPATGRLILEYGDYECPYSRRAFREIQRVLAHRDDVGFVFRHFPLTSIHPHALAAAAAVEAAALQGRFWDMQAHNVVALVFVAAFAPEEGENLGEATAASQDAVLSSTLVPRRHAWTPGHEPVVEFSVDPARFHDAFAADLPARQSAVLAATQRPIAEAGFTDPAGPPAWKDLPAWAVVATSDKAAGTDVVRSMAVRAGATIREIDGSHAIMISQPERVAGVILEALAAAAGPGA